MTALIAEIRQYWFFPAPSQRLALLRIFTGGFVLLYLLSRFDILTRITQVDPSQFAPVGLLQWMPSPLSPNQFLLFFWLLLILNITYMIGWKFKYTGPAFAILQLLFFTYYNSWSVLTHQSNTLVLQILIIGLVSAADSLSFDAWRAKITKGVESQREHWQYGWPIRLICAATLMTYFLSGTTKVAEGIALEWANGTALRSQIAIYTIRQDLLGVDTSSLFHLLYPYEELFLFFGIATLVLQLGAPLALFGKRLGMIWAIMAWMMHWGTFLLVGITFIYQMSGLVFLPFFDIEKWFTRKKNGKTG